MTISEIKTKARAQLGNNIFSQSWIAGLLILLIEGLIIGFAGSVTAGIVTILAVGPLSYGVARIFLTSSREGKDLSTDNIGDIFKGFTEDFGGTFLIGLLSGIFVFLWSLLFIVPGIIKAYAYSMAYYVKCDHPEYDWKQCITESRRIMNGHKGKLFLLDLSFIGWYIVGALCLGIGTFWVDAYVTAAHTQFYESIKDTAKENA